MRSRWLAAAAWVLAFALFVLLYPATWGYAPAAMFFWMLVAIPLGVITAWWMARAGKPLDDYTLGGVALTALALLIGQVPLIIIGDSALGDRIEPFLAVIWWPMMVPYLVFPLAVTAWMLERIKNLPRK